MAKEAEEIINEIQARKGTDLADKNIHPLGQTPDGAEGQLQNCLQEVSQGRKKFLSPGAVQRLGDFAGGGAIVLGVVLNSEMIAAVGLSRFAGEFLYNSYRILLYRCK